MSRTGCSTGNHSWQSSQLWGKGNESWFPCHDPLLYLNGTELDPREVGDTTSNRSRTNSNPGTPWRTEYPQVICILYYFQLWMSSTPGVLKCSGRLVLQWELWQLMLALICRCLVVRTSWWIVHIKIAKRGNEKKGIFQPTWRLLRCILKEVFIGNFSRRRWTLVLDARHAGAAPVESRSTY